MKLKKYHLFFLAASLIAFSCPGGQAAEYTVDPAHSHVGFQVRHIVSKLQGEFKDFEGAFSFDEKKANSSKGKFTIKTASINTNHEKRDNHLRSPDFFDIQKYPTLSFESKSFTPEGERKYKLEGNLNIHGVARSVTFEVEYLGADTDPAGIRRAGFTAAAKINRKDYGIVWNKVLDSGGLLIGDDVDINLLIEAIEKK